MPRITATARDDQYLLTTYNRSYISSAVQIPAGVLQTGIHDQRHDILIDEFGRRTGVPVVMNTSFNLRGEAIVHTHTDAIRTFFSSGMDALVLGSYLIEK